MRPEPKIPESLKKLNDAVPISTVVNKIIEGHLKKFRVYCRWEMGLTATSLEALRGKPDKWVIEPVDPEREKEYLQIWKQAIDLCITTVKEKVNEM
jgi:hypothetical protein